MARGVPLYAEQDLQPGLGSRLCVGVQQAAQGRVRGTGGVQLGIVGVCVRLAAFKYSESMVSS